MLFVILAADGDLVARRHRLLKLLQLRHHNIGDLRGQVPGRREGKDGHLREVIDADDATGRHAVLDVGDLHQRNFAALIRRAGIDVQVLNIGEPGALVRLEAGDDRDLLVAFLKRGDGAAGHGAGGGVGHVEVRDACQVGTIGVDLQRDLEVLLVPLIAHATRFDGGAHDVLHAVGDLAHLGDVFRAANRAHVSLADDADLDRIVEGIGL